MKATKIQRAENAEGAETRESRLPKPHWLCRMGLHGWRKDGSVEWQQRVCQRCGRLQWFYEHRAVWLDVFPQERRRWW